MKFYRFGILLITFLCAIGNTACSNRDLLDAQALYRSGQIEAARGVVHEYASQPKARPNHINSLIARIETASLERATGNIQASREAFRAAHQQAEYYDQQAEVSLSSQALATVTNLNYLPYRGTAYDRIMLSVYSAANELILGNVDNARVFLNRAYERQRQAVDINAKRISNLTQASQNYDQRSDYVNLSATQDSDSFQRAMDRQYASLGQFIAYADYVNPFAELFQGIYFQHAAKDANDISWAQQALRRAAAMAPGNTYLVNDMQRVDNIATGQAQPTPMTYVIFETGIAPHLEAVRVDLPLVLVTREIDYVGASFPKLVFNSTYLPYVAAQVNGQWHRTQKVCDMDQVVATEFENELPRIITQTVIASASKAAIAHALRRASRDDDKRDVFRDDDKRRRIDWGNLLTRVAVAGYQVAMNEADLRTWATLPKQFQYASFPTPDAKTIEISAEGHPPQRIPVVAGKSNVIWVKSVLPRTGLQIWNFTLD